MLDNFFDKICVIRAIRIQQSQLIVEADGALKDWWGVHQASFLNTNLQHWIVPEDISTVLEASQQLSDEYPSYDLYYHINTPTNQHIKIREQAFWVEQQGINYIQSIFSAVPASKKGTNLQDFPYQFMLESSFDPIVIIKGNQVINCNSSFTEYFGFNPKSYDIEGFAQQICPKNYFGIFNSFIQKSVYSTSITNTELDVALLNKEAIPIQLKLRLSAQKHADRNWLILRFVDDSSTRETHQFLINQKEHYQYIVNTSQEGVILFEKDRILEVNNKVAEVLNCSTEDLRNRSLLELVEDKELIAKYLEENEKNPNIERDIVIPYILPSKTEIYIRIASRVIETDGRYLRYLFISDITKSYQTQKALKESRNKYKLLSDLTKEFILIYNNQGVVVEANSTFCLFIGLNELEITDKKLSDIFPTEIVQSLQKPQLHKGIYKIPAQNGKIHYLEYECSSLIQDDHILQYVVMYDITDRYQSQARLEESQKRFELFENASLEAIAIHRNGVLKEANAAYRKLFQLQADDISGLDTLQFVLDNDRPSVTEALGIFESILGKIDLQSDKCPKDLKSFVNNELYSILKKAPIDPLYRELPYPFGPIRIPLRRKDGSTFVAETRNDFVVIDGEIFQYHIINDITWRISTDRQLEESRNKYKLLADLTQEAIVIHDLNGKIVEVNKAYCTLFKTEADHIIGKTGIEFVPSSEIELFMEKILPYAEVTLDNFDQVETHSDVLRFQDSKGKHFIAEYRTNHVCIDNEVLRYTLIRDITEITKNQKLLEASTKKYKRLSSITREGVIIHKKGCILETNQATTTLLGWTEEDLIGRSLYEMMGTQEFSQTYAENRSADQFKRICLQKIDGQKFIAEILEHPITINSEELQYLIIRDITEQIHYEQRIEELIEDLSEKNKHIHCLFELAHLASNQTMSLDQLMEEALDIIPNSLQYSEWATAAIQYGNKTWTSPKYEKTPWHLHAEIKINQVVKGSLMVCYLKSCPTTKDHSPFLQSELDLINVLGSQMSILIEKKLSEDRVIASVLEAEDRERTRISKELHDSLGQLLMAISLNLESLKRDIKFLSEKNQNKLHNALNYLQEAILESRNIAHNLMPKAINDYGYVLAVQSMIEGLKGSDDLQFHFYNNLDTERLPPNIELSLFRITQEAITNILKHAQAKNITIQLMKYPDMLILTIEDDGQGFEQDKKTNNFGLESIKNRANAISGVSIIESKVDYGTTIMIEVPL